MPNPSDYDNKDDFISACIAQRQDENPDESQEQSSAICYSMWSDKGFEDIIVKTRTSKVETNSLDFILSDATQDRYGDIIEAEGWVLDNFQKNPIALFNHRSDFPIGVWDNLRVERGALRGRLEMAPKGSSDRIDELRALIDANILRAVSVGFIPLANSTIKDAEGSFVGYRYTKQELLETSLVSVPANPNAVMEAKRLKISDGTMNVVFGEHAIKKSFYPADGDTMKWGGRVIPVKRYIVDDWRGQKIYRYD